MSDSVIVAGPSRRAPRWLWVVLIASLAVNLFVVGVVARSVMPNRYAAANNGAGGLFGNLVAYLRDLPAERRVAIRQSAPKDKPQLALRSLREDLRAARREASRLFRAEVFDREQFLIAEGRVQNAEAKMRETVVKFAAELANQMTAEERAGFLKWRELRRLGGPNAQAERDPDTAPALKKKVE